jgi:hypothetical protein
LGGIEAWAYEIENAAEGEIVADNLGELLGMDFGVVRAGAEVSYGDADSFYAESRACSKPSLFALLCADGPCRES